MQTLEVRSRSKFRIEDKPRVYFTCHPDDFERYFERICDDLFKTQDCAVYYTADMGSSLPEETREIDLGRMNLFVIPVTRRLLSEANRAMDEDYPFARSHHIPVLPLMFEPEEVALYSRSDRFGELQYLDPATKDLTAVSYEDKLKNRLESILVNEHTARLIRDAFDAYVFLSYRKKDRVHANRLMRLIHDEPRCRDLAIWYDEFLVPGESFRQSIEEALKTSKLFMLLVTPNILEEPGGVPNFVMAEEYPAARKAHMDILPVEMDRTDRKRLAEKFDGLPPCLPATDQEVFRTRLLDSLDSIDLQKGVDDPKHNYLMGLAYLDGIDVEIDRTRALELISEAAEAGLSEAMHKLKDMYHEGMGVKLDYEKSLSWQRRIVEDCERQFGPQDMRTLIQRRNLAEALVDAGDYAPAVRILEELNTHFLQELVDHTPHYVELFSTMRSLTMAYSSAGQAQKAIDIGEQAWKLQRELLGEKNPRTLGTLQQLAIAYDIAGDHERALELNDRLYRMRSELFGEEDSSTVTTMNELAQSYSSLGQHDKAIPLFRKAYELASRTLGPEDLTTVGVLSNLAGSLQEKGEWKEATTAMRQAYDLYRKILGERHPDTLRALSNLASNLMKLMSFSEANELYEQAYALRCETLGPEHPDTLRTLSYLALSRYMLKDFEKAATLLQQAHEAQVRTQGENHPDTKRTEAMLTSILSNSFVARMPQDIAGIVSPSPFGSALQVPANEQLWQRRDAYRRLSAERGDEDLETLAAMDELAEAYGSAGELQKELELRERSYELRRDLQGDEHPDTIAALTALAQICDELEDYGRALMLQEREYVLKRRLYGDEDERTIDALVDLAYTCDEQGNHQKAYELLWRAYRLQCATSGEDGPDATDTLREIEELRDEHPELREPADDYGYDEEDDEDDDYEEDDFDDDDEDFYEDDEDEDDEPLEEPAPRGLGASLRRFFGR